MADYFISYTKTDRDWAFWIAKELEALGHTPHVHEWEIQAGDDIYAWMERRHDAADHVLCVVSDEYLDDLKAPYSRLERNAALWQAGSKAAPVRSVRGRQTLQAADALRPHPPLRTFRHPARTARRTRFRDYLTDPDHRRGLAIPGQVFAVSNIPIRVPTHFMGRDDALAQIAAALAQHEGRVAITALHGLARRRQDHAGRGLRGAPARRLPGDLVDPGAGGNLHACRSGRPRHPARLGARR